MTRPRLLDLFCGAGGASVGYSRAGFEVTGVDIRPQPHYPFTFYQADVFDALPILAQQADAIHASPPCQHASTLRNLSPGKSYADLIEATRVALDAIGKPWVLENVYGARLLPPVVMFCGSMFGLGAHCQDGVYRQLRRHRFFELSFGMLMALECCHQGQPVDNYGNGGYRDHKVVKGINGYVGTMNERRAAMGIDWMNRYELSQSIPPHYTEYIGRQLKAILERNGCTKKKRARVYPDARTEGACGEPAVAGSSDLRAREHGAADRPADGGRDGSESVCEVPPAAHKGAAGGGDRPAAEAAG